MDVAPPLPCPGYVNNKCPPLTSEVDHTDYLAIEDLLDFSNEEIGGLIVPCSSNATSEAKFSEVCGVFSPKESQKPAMEFDFDEVCGPCDELAELEWLSNFVEESFSSAGDSSMYACMPFCSYATIKDGESGDHLGNDPFQTTSPVSVLETSPKFPGAKLCSPCTSSPDSFGSVPGRARSKRRRTAVCFWNTHILCAGASESLLGSSMIMASASSHESSALTDYDDEGDGSDEGEDPYPLLDQLTKDKKGSFKARIPLKLLDSSSKPKKFKVEDASTAQVRKCLHCGMQKTPQWRAGPMGLKTLCNACGVRYKSGRLCDEYRPAASPTFNENVHSNSHRKVMEMRRQKGDNKVGQLSHDRHEHVHFAGNGGKESNGNFSKNGLSLSEDSY